MPLLRLDASIRLDGSHTRVLGDLIEREWADAHPGDPVIRRDIGTHPLPSAAWAEAAIGSRTPSQQRTAAQREALALGFELVNELDAADALVLAVPLYNFGPSQHVKAWVDMVVTDPRMAAGTEPLLAGKPAALIVARGGAYGPDTPRAGWDHSTPYLQRVLADSWGMDVHVLEREFTLVGINPALDQFKELAEEMASGATRLAKEHGRALAASRRPTTPGVPTN